MTSVGRSGQQAPTADRLLSDDEVDEAGHLAVVVQRRHPLLESADAQHPPVHLDQVIDRDGLSCAFHEIDDG